MGSPIPAISKVVAIPDLRDPLGKLADSGIISSVSRIVSGLDPGRKGALILVAGADGPQLAGVVKVSDHFEVAGVVGYNGHFTGQAAAVFQW